MSARPASGPLADRPTVVFAGRLVPEKGLDVLLRAFRRVVDRVPEAHLVVAGDGPERGALDALAESLGLAAHLTTLGYRPAEAVAERFAGAWVQAVPSMWEEPFGMVAAEAAMRGTAVVATQSGGLCEIVDDGVTGRLVPAGDVAAWADALTDLLTDRDRAEAMGRRGRVVAHDRFSVAVHTDRFLALYRQLVGASAPEAVVPALVPAPLAA